jgi:hypothetical protein
VFRFVDRLVQLIVYFTVSGIKAVIPGHLEIFFGDMLDKQFYKVNGRKGFFDKSVVFVPVIMEGHIVPVIGIDPGKGDDGASKVAADIFNNGFWVTEIGFGINVKSVFILMVYFRF